MSQDTQLNPPQKSTTNRTIITLAGGLAAGMVLMALAVWQLMPGMMIVSYPSKYHTVEETCVKLQEAIKAEGWVSPAVRNMNQAMAKHQVVHESPIRIVELCKAPYAHEVLSEKPELATLMPCAYGVYEGADGKVYISAMNVGLMGKMFGGVVARVMGGQVAHDEHNILQRVARM